MKYNVVQFITNTAGAYSAKVSATFDNLTSAKVNYFGVAQTLNNASDVASAVVKIVDQYGNDVGYRESIDNTTTVEETTEE